MPAVMAPRLAPTTNMSTFNVPASTLLVAQHQLDGWREITPTDDAALSHRRIRRERAPTGDLCAGRRP
jgi:hypothetical protein